MFLIVYNNYLRKQFESNTFLVSLLCFVLFYAKIVEVA